MKARGLLILTVIFFLQVGSVKAIPSAALIPVIGPVIAQLLLLLLSAAFFILSRIRKYRKFLMVLGSLLVIFVISSMTFGLFG